MSEVVRELTDDEQAYLSALAEQAERYAQRAREYRALLQQACNMIADEGRVVNLERGVIEADDEPTNLDTRAE